MGGLVTGKRLSGGLVVVLAAVLLAGGTAWLVRGTGGLADSGVDAGESYPSVPGDVAPVAADEISHVSVALDVHTYDMGEEGHGDTVGVTVVNDSGRELPAIALDVTVDDPGGDLPPMTVAGHSASCYKEEEFDDPDGKAKTEKYVDEGCLQRQREGKEGCTLSPLGDDEVPLSRHARCFRTLKDGENKFEFDVKMLVDNITEIRDYPQLTVTAKLSAAGEVFASDEDTLKTKYPKEWDRLEFSGVPETVDTNRTEDSPYAWSFTVTNNTGDDIVDGSATLSTTYDTGVDSDHPGCRRDKDEPKHRYLTCEGLDVPAGGSVTVNMTVYYGGNIKSLKEDNDCERPGDDCGQDRIELGFSDEDGKTFASGEAVTTVRLAE